MSTIHGYIDAPPPRLASIDDLRASLEDLGIANIVTIQPAPDRAEVCIFHSCRETKHLFCTIIEGFGQRVLCPEHAVGLIRREVLDDE